MYNSLTLGNHQNIIYLASIDMLTSLAYMMLITEVVRTELEKSDQAVGAYPIAYVSNSADQSRFYVNYPSGSVAVFPFESWANEYAKEYNQNNQH